MTLEAFGGRRWITAVGLILLAAGLLIAARLNGAQWVELVTWVYGIYSGANVTQRGVEAAKEVKASKTEPTEAQ